MSKLLVASHDVFWRPRSRSTTCNSTLMLTHVYCYVKGYVAKIAPPTNLSGPELCVQCPDVEQNASSLETNGSLACWDSSQRIKPGTVVVVVVVVYSQICIKYMRHSETLGWESPKILKSFIGFGDKFSIKLLFIISRKALNETLYNNKILISNKVVTVNLFCKSLNCHISFSFYPACDLNSNQYRL